MDYQAWLDQNDGDALKALEALYKERQTKIDSEGTSAQRARKQRDDAKAELETVKDELADAKKGKAPEGSVILSGDDATEWQALTEKGGRDYLKGRLSRAEDADKLEKAVIQTKAAAVYGVNDDDLTEWLAGRPLAEGKVKDATGADVHVIGLEVEGSVKPLASFNTFAALINSKKPDAGKPFVLQQTKTDKPLVADPVSELNRRLFGTKKE